MSIKVVNTDFIPWKMRMRIVFFFKNVIQSFNWVNWLIMDLVNFHWLEHFLRRSFNYHFFEIRIIDDFFLWLFTHFLLKGHSGCELIYLHDNFVSWHSFKVFLAWTYFSDFLVKIELLNFKNLVHDLSLMI